MRFGSNQGLIADGRNPDMGLNNQRCSAPVYWCRSKQVWLSEEDVIRKECKNKLSFDMMFRNPCGCLEKKDFREWIQRAGFKFKC